jgi:hypothetical protein
MEVPKDLNREFLIILSASPMAVSSMQLTVLGCPSVIRTTSRWNSSRRPRRAWRGLGHLDDALAAINEAVTIRRGLAEARPGVFL